jgi:hypothetical protein
MASTTVARTQPLVTHVACPLEGLVGRPFAQESNSLSQLELIFDRQHCFFINYCGCI